MKTISIAVCILALSQVLWGLIPILAKTALVDFHVYYTYGQLFLSGSNPYAQPIPLNYPPSSLLLFLFFPLFPYAFAQLIFTGISLFLFLYSMYPLMREYHVSLSFRFIILSFLIQMFPAKFTLVLGQINFFVLFLVILSFIFDQKKRNVLSGICLGASCMIKLIPAPLVLYFLIKKRYSTAFWATVSFVLGNGIVLALLKDTKRYFSMQLPALFSQTHTVTSLYDQSLRAFLFRLGISGNEGILISVGIVFLFLIFAILQYKAVNSKNSSCEDSHRDLVFFSLILAISTVGNSFAWQHHLVFLFPGFVAETMYFLKSKSTIRGILLVLSIVLVGYHFPDIAHPPTTNPLLISHSLIGALLLIGLLLAHQKEYKEHKKIMFSEI